MSIIVKGIEMPKNCYLCPFCDYVSGRCDAVKGTPYTPENRYDQRADWCPLVEAPEWISVKERLPEQIGSQVREKYLVHLASGCIQKLYFEFPTEGWHFTGSPVTHWMPLPEPPKEGKPK